MKFSELSESAKDRARDNWREHSLDYEWWDSTYEDWKEKLTAKGFLDAEIRFSGFSCQGDGASFTCTVDRDLPKKLKARFKKMEKVARVVARLTGEQHGPWSYEICAKITRNDHHYVHQYTISVTVDIQFYGSITEPMQNELCAWAEELETSLTAQARDLSSEIYDALEKEWDYLNSDESIDELVSDDQFDEDGDELSELPLAA